MQEPPRKTNPSSAEEWKRKYLTESKVNQELGRRLHDMKQQLEDERARYQVDTMKAVSSSTTTEATTGTCSSCETLQAEVARLRKLLIDNNIPLPDNISESKAVIDTPPEMTVDIHNPQRRTHSILVRRLSGGIQCLRDMLDELTPRGDGSGSPTKLVVPRRQSIQLALPIAPLPVIENPQPTKEAAIDEEPPKPVVSAQPSLVAKTQPMKQDSGKPGYQEIEASNSSAMLRGIEDKSLGDLFKYAIVLTGPMQRPKKSALSSFFKAADFRRSKSQDTGAALPSDSLAFNPARKGSVRVDAAKSKLTRTASISTNAGSTSPASASSQSLPDFIAPPDASRSKSAELVKIVPPGSPMKRSSAWLSNIMSPRFRAPSADTPPSLAAKTEPKIQPPASPAKPLFSKGVDPTKPRMLTVYPPTDKSGVAELEGLQEICFPYGEKLPPLSDFSVANLKRTLQERHRTYRSPDSTFVLTIASAKNPTEITYAVCVHLPLFPDDDSGTGPDNIDGDGDKLPSHGCISLLSNYPFFSLFFKVVFGIASIWESRRKEYVQDFAIAQKERKAPPMPLTIKDFVDHFQSVMLRMKEMRVPAMGGWTRLVLAPQYTALAFHRPHSRSVSAERRMLVLEYAAPVLFALLSVDQVLFLLGCLCCERKVLVVSDHANVVSSCVLALITLLEPLQWAGPVITLLPPRLDELLEAPVPLIAGRVSINSGTIPNFSTLTKPMNGVIEMNMDQNNLCMHEEDLMKYHELKLPGCDALVHELHQFSGELFEQHMTPDFPTIEQMQACDIICARIHKHMQSICSIANGEATTLDVGSPLYCASPRRQTTAADPLWVRRCSDAVQDYIQRFQGTQMFSMFKLQRQDEREDEDLDDDDDDDDDTGGDGLLGHESSDGELDGGMEDYADTETLVFPDEAISSATVH